MIFEIVGSECESSRHGIIRQSAILQARIA